MTSVTFPPRQAVPRRVTTCCRLQRLRERPMVTHARLCLQNGWTWPCRIMLPARLWWQNLLPSSILSLNWENLHVGWPILRKRKVGSLYLWFWLTIMAVTRYLRFSAFRLRWWCPRGRCKLLKN
ncbi:hypothetical protein FCV25MIE_25781 [Fagus crenata]